MPYIQPWDCLDNRYYVLKTIGTGTFADVYMAFDTRSPPDGCPFVAVKVLTWTYPSFDSLKELEAYKSLDRAEYSPDRDRIIKMLDDFELVELATGQKYSCFVFELHQGSLADFLKGYRLLTEHMKSVISQILEGLAFLHYSCKLIHGDLKLENILVKPDAKTLVYKCRRAFTKAKILLNAHRALRESLPATLLGDMEIALLKMDEQVDLAVVNRAAPKLKIVIADLGSSVVCNQFCKRLVQTRLFRAPEVILGMTYGFRVDLWSLGCMVFQMATGRYLFNITDNRIQSEEEIDLQHMIIIQKKIGPVAPVLFSSEKGERIFATCPELIERIPESHLYLESFLNSGGYSKEGAIKIGSFLRVLLQIDPNYRMNARDSLTHSFLTEQAPSLAEIRFNELQLILDEIQGYYF